MTSTELLKKYGDFDEDILYEIVNFEMEDVVKQVLGNEITNKTGIDINEIKSFE